MTNMSLAPTCVPDSPTHLFGLFWCSAGGFIAKFRAEHVFAHILIPAWLSFLNEFCPSSVFRGFYCQNLRNGLNSLNHLPSFGGLGLPIAHNGDFVMRLTWCANPSGTDILLQQSLGADTSPKQIACFDEKVPPESNSEFEQSRQVQIRVISWRASNSFYFVRECCRRGKWKWFEFGCRRKSMFRKNLNEYF